MGVGLVLPLSPRSQEALIRQTSDDMLCPLCLTHRTALHYVTASARKLPSQRGRNYGPGRPPKLWWTCATLRYAHTPRSTAPHKPRICMLPERPVFLTVPAYPCTLAGFAGVPGPPAGLTSSHKHS